MYGQAKQCTKRQVIWLLGSQVQAEATRMGLRRIIRAAVTEWATATIQLTRMQDIAQVYTEHVVAQVVARTQGALPREADNCAVVPAW